MYQALPRVFILVELLYVLALNNDHIVHISDNIIAIKPEDGALQCKSSFGARTSKVPHTYAPHQSFLLHTSQ